MFGDEESGEIERQRERNDEDPLLRMRVTNGFFAFLAFSTFYKKSLLISLHAETNK